MSIQEVDLNGLTNDKDGFIEWINRSREAGINIPGNFDSASISNHMAIAVEVYQYNIPESYVYALGMVTQH